MTRRGLTTHRLQRASHDPVSIYALITCAYGVTTLMHFMHLHQVERLILAGETNEKRARCNLKCAFVNI